MAGYEIFATQEPSRPIRPTDHPHLRHIPGMIAAGNGTTAFGRVLEGTLLGRVTSGGLLRPVGKALFLAGAASATQEIGVSHAPLFFAADAVKIISVAGRVGARTFAASAGDATITVTGRNADGKSHTVALVDPSANDSPLAVSVVYDTNGVGAISVSLATGGAGAITSTVAQVVAALNGAAAGGLVFAASGGTASQTAIAVTALALQGGIAPGGDVATGLTVVSVDLAEGDVVLSSSVTTIAGDSLQLTNGAQNAVGILERRVNTYDVTKSNATGAVAHAVVTDPPVALEGLYTLSALIGANTLTLADLNAKIVGTIVKA